MDGVYAGGAEGCGTLFPLDMPDDALPLLRANARELIIGRIRHWKDTASFVRPTYLVDTVYGGGTTGLDRYAMFSVDTPWVYGLDDHVGSGYPPRAEADWVT